MRVNLRQLKVYQVLTNDEFFMCNYEENDNSVMTALAKRNFSRGRELRGVKRRTEVEEQWWKGKNSRKVREQNVIKSKAEGKGEKRNGCKR